MLLSPGAANSNDTTNSSINSTDQDGELNDRDTCDKGDKGTTKPNQRMDIFSMILNQKKSSLMRDPEVIRFMENLTGSKK
uniref:RFXA_RFXANK_bdg domain-containing protein n=1 Tax=Anopheles epiroticus TaxID=199890 RepID=A0A182PAV8_9DIPT